MFRQKFCKAAFIVQAFYDLYADYYNPKEDELQIVRTL